MNLTTGYPFPLINSGLPYKYPKLEESVKTDVVIIGGGISGALTAYYLINAGIKCIVADARTIGLGSTCASTSLLQYELDKPLTELTNLIGWDSAMRSYKLCSRSIDKLESIFKNKRVYFLLQRSPIKNYWKRNLLRVKKPGLMCNYCMKKKLKNNSAFVHHQQFYPLRAQSQTLIYLHTLCFRQVLKKV